MSKLGFDYSGDGLSIELYYKKYELFPVNVTITQIKNRTDYCVTFKNGSQARLFMNEELKWCEIGKGITERSEAIGLAIENYFN